MRRVLVVERGVVAQLAGQPGHLVGAAGAAHDARGALELRELPDEAADRAGGARDEHRVALAERGLVQQADPGGEAGPAEHAEVRRRAHAVGRRDLLHLLRGHDAVGAPREVGRHEVADGDLVAAARDDLAHRAPVHGLVQPERRHVRGDVVHATAHVGVDGEVVVGDEDLALARLGELPVDEREVVGLGESGGAADEVDLAGGHGRSAHVSQGARPTRVDAVTRVAPGLSRVRSPSRV